eukprot:85732-Chlamydomonas_euryale.AAC.2
MQNLAVMGAAWPSLHACSAWTTCAWMLPILHACNACPTHAAPSSSRRRGQPCFPARTENVNAQKLHPPRPMRRRPFRRERRAPERLGGRFRNNGGCRLLRSGPGGFGRRYRPSPGRDGTEERGREGSDVGARPGETRVSCAAPPSAVFTRARCARERMSLGAPTDAARTCWSA